jgi:hypothetical protein
MPEADDDPAVPVHCPECETTTRVPLSTLAEAIERHNENLHDGAERARVDLDAADQLADLVAEDLGLFD